MKPKTFRVLVTVINFVFVIAVMGAIIYFLTKPKQVVIINQQSPPTVVQQQQQQQPVSRDRLVINDPLYPPLNRSDNHGFDTYRLVGYLSNHDPMPDKGGNNWKMFARMKDRHQGDYYISPVDRTIDIKIPLTNEVVVGERLRDIYTIPQEMRFRSPMLNNGPYEFTEIPRSQLDNPMYI